MKAVNIQTQFLLEKVRGRLVAAKKAGKPLLNPFTVIDGARKALGREWDDESRSVTIDALEQWFISLVSGMLTSVMGEIIAAGVFASNSEAPAGKKAAIELAPSMPFIEDVFGLFNDSIDFGYVAEQCFEECREECRKDAEASEAAEKAAYEKRCEPSAN